MRKGLGHKKVQCLATRNPGGLFFSFECKRRKWFTYFKRFASMVGISASPLYFLYFFFLYYYFYSPCPWHPKDALAAEARCGAAQPFPGSWGATRSLQVGALPREDKNSKKADEDCSVLAKLCLAPETEGQQAVTGQA